MKNKNIGRKRKRESKKTEKVESTKPDQKKSGYF